MATAPPPSKLKACLAKLKEEALPDDCSSQNVDSEYCVLLATELVQRGVLPSNLDLASILELVRSTAGRALLETTSIPKPLLAASAALSGMVAERCCTLLELQSFNIEISDAYKSALERCRDVEDDRLGTLLQLPFVTQDDLDQIREWRLRCLQIAEGQYLRAASFQPEPPQMWKRTLDVVVSRHDLDGKALTDPPEAAFPLKELIRVAESKRNDKRVSELSLRLAESLLSSETQSFSMQEELQKGFVSPYRPTESDNLADRTDQAREALTKCNLPLLEGGDTDCLSVRYNTAALEIEMAHESAEIQELAAEKHTASKNRSDGLSSSTASLASCKQSVRKQVLRRVLESSDKHDPIDEKAVLLRDSVLSMISSPEIPQMSIAMDLVCLQVERLEDRARAIALAAQSKKPTCNQQDVLWAWSTVASFVSPILDCIKGNCGDNPDQSSIMMFFEVQPLAGRHMVTTCAMACVSTVWMTAANEAHDHKIMEFVVHVLSCSLEIYKTEEQQRKSGNGNVVKSIGNEKDSMLFQLQCARASAMCLLQMSTVKNASSTLQTITEEAIAMANKADWYEADQIKFGTGFLQFLVCWSGLYRSAWPFCNISQARAIVHRARQGFKHATVSWGRPALLIETVLLNLGEADAEGGLLVGGFVRQAGALYKQVLEQLEGCKQNGNDHLNKACLTLLNTHCLNGLARIALQGGTDAAALTDEQVTKSGPERAELSAREALQELEKLRSEKSCSLYLWALPSASNASLVFHVSVARQLVADSLLRASRPNDAQCFLEDAVSDAPLDFDAALALGAFRLRMVFFCQGGAQQPPTAADEKLAQTQLLKAAKLDSAKADPFALLGLWYEKRGDAKRAVGCYSKALLLEPPHPVAGRGILRLKPFYDVKNVCDAASNTNSPLNGWAWRALGQSKAMVSCDDELAIVCYQKALRCRDIECPGNESLGVFYPLPSHKFEPPSFNSDFGDTWAELAGCYRRLGRYSAAARAFESANDAVPDGLSSSVVCSWAQVEVDLGLHEEAAEKFALVLARDDISSHPTAAYGQGSALLALAHRDAQDGKGGCAFELLKRAIDGLEGSLVKKQGGLFCSSFVCALKCLGDIYSFGAWLPPDVFLEEPVGGESKDDATVQMVRSQISFVALGEDAYRAALQAHEKDGDDGVDVVEASFICDIGTNKLLQAQLLASVNGEAGEGPNESSMSQIIERVPEVREMFDSAAKNFQRAVEKDPLYPPGWCGLGCAVCGVDPLLSQHAFCRALQLDKTSPDVWANLGFLYATHDSMKASAAMMDALTQVADSPMMWIGRAFLLERMAFASDGLNNEVAADAYPEALVSQAADAYRASLQVVKHPSALLGLSLTCRMTPKAAIQQRSEYANVSQRKARVESFACMSEFLDVTGGVNTGASALGSAMTMEDWVKNNIESGVPWNRDDRENDASTESQIGKPIDNRTKMNLLQNLSMHNRGDASALDNVEEEEKVESSSQFDHELSISRQIVHDPDNGKLWLQLAKNLANELISVTSSGSPKRKIVRTTLDAAILAADRAEKFLTEQLSNPKQLTPTRHLHDHSNQEETFSLSQPPVPRVVDARDVSDALSLGYWVTKAGSEISEDVTVSKEKIFDLQRALIMCPSNTFAREALRMESNSSDATSSDKVEL